MVPGYTIPGFAISRHENLPALRYAVGIFPKRRYGTLLKIAHKRNYSVQPLCFSRAPTAPEICAT
jgi:hypothetical protein